MKGHKDKFHQKIEFFFKYILFVKIKLNVTKFLIFFVLPYFRVLRYFAQFEEKKLLIHILQEMEAP